MLSSRRDEPRFAALDDVALRVATGAPLPAASSMPQRCRRAVAVAAIVGSPIADAVDAARAAEEDLAEARRAVAVASAQARAVAAVLLVAPFFVTPALARIVDVDLTAFFSTAAGVVVLGVAGILYAAGASIVLVLVRRAATADGRHGSSSRGSFLVVAVAVASVFTWTVIGPLMTPIAALVAHRLMTRRAGPSVTPGADEAVDLVATALHGAVGVPEAVRLVADQLPDLSGGLRRLAWDLQSGSPIADGDRPLPVSGQRAVVRRHGSAADGIPRLGMLLHTAEETGAAVAPTLHRLASQLRADHLAERLAAAERLPAHLTFPTALFLLPATVLLIGAPIVHAGWSAAGW